MKSALILGLVALSTSVLSIGSVSADDFYDRLARTQEINENAARGGPQPQGANSPFMERVQVCKALPTKIRDPQTGVIRVELRKRCWFQ